MIEYGGEGICAVPGRERGGSRDQRGSGGGGKRVNRESTCKQATRETNNVGAAGCSPPNEAGGRSQAARQTGKQARVRSLHRCALRFPCAFAPTIRSNVSRVRLIKSRAPRFEREVAEQLYLRRVLRAAAASAAAAVRKPAEIRKRERHHPDRGRSARHSSTDSLRPVSPV